MADSRNKGKGGELEVAALWRGLGYKTARRGLQFNDGTDNADIIGVPYWIEVKRYKRIYPSTLAAGYRQGMRNMIGAVEKQYIPDLKDVIVMARGDNGKWQVLAPIQLLIDLGCPFETTPFKHKYIEAKHSVAVVLWEQFAQLQRRFDIERE